MKKALLLPSRHDEKIAAALAQATASSASERERHTARDEWQRLVARRRLEKLCIALQSVGRYGLFAVVAVVMLFFRPPASAFAEARISEFWLPLLVCAAGGGAVAIAKYAAEILRQRIAERFPASDDF